MNQNTGLEEVQYYTPKITMKMKTTIDNNDANADDDDSGIVHHDDRNN